MTIAIIDSGIHADHPHVGGIAGAVHITPTGFGPDPVDRLGHGTAVAGAIREQSPNAELYAVKIFDQRLSAPIGAVLRALEWCREQKMDLANLSLGTANLAHRDALLQAIQGEMFVISAAEMLPGSLPGVIGVRPDTDCPRDEFGQRDGVFYASPFPRPIPGVPRSYNLQGVSFAVANMTGLAAQVFATTGKKDFLRTLIERASYLPETSSESVGVEYSRASE